MTETILLGTLIVLLGGLMQGSFALPMKYASQWSWESSWGAYSLVGLVIIPWITAIATVPRIGDVYRSVPVGQLVITLAFGFGWGIANVLFGLAVQMVGMAISFAIVVGMSAALGSLIPFLFLTKQPLPQTAREIVLSGLFLVLCGVALLGIAGRRREKSLSKDLGAKNVKYSATAIGILLCLVAGILAPMLNFSFAFGGLIVKAAIRYGSRPGVAANATWAIALLGGSISNGGYCIVKFFQNGTWSEFKRRDAPRHWLLAVFMAALWTGGLLLYGRGAIALGSLGPVIGWPLFQVSMIVISSLWGGLTGEWRGSDPLALRLNYLALGTLIAAIGVLSIGNRV